MNPCLLEMELQQRREEMVKETRRRQLVARFNAHHRQKNSDRLLLAVADLLIALGEGLKRRHCRQPLLVTATCRKS